METPPVIMWNKVASSIIACLLIKICGDKHANKRCQRCDRTIEDLSSLSPTSLRADSRAAAPLSTRVGPLSVALVCCSAIHGAEVEIVNFYYMHKVTPDCCRGNTLIRNWLLVHTRPPQLHRCHRHLRKAFADSRRRVT